MKTVKAKLLAGLAALCSCFLCLGVGIAVSTPETVSTITAEAETIVYKVETLTYCSGGSSLIEAYPNDGSGKPTGDWDNAYTLVSGQGATLNGVSITPSIKQPNDFYIELGVEAQSGDIFTISGLYYNEAKDVRFEFNHCSLQYNGSGWVTYNEVISYNIGALNLHGNSIGSGVASGFNNALYLQRADANALPLLSWEYAFAYESGNGFQVNGVQKTPSGIKSTGDGFYVGFDGVNAGDVVSISGTFFCESRNVKYVIEDSYFQWSGSGWSVYVPATVHNIGALELHVNSSVGGASGLNSALYLQRADGSALPILSWDYFFAYESGNGFQVNGVQKTPSAIKSTGDGFYLAFDALTAGDIVSISGTFFCESQNVKYVITESKFVWNGTGWEAYVDSEVEYTTHELGAVTAITGNTGVYLHFASGVSLPVDSWDYAFARESGSGITVNGVEVSMENNLKSVGGSLYVTVANVLTTGNILVIDGTFYNETCAVKYVVDQSTFVWNGSAWTDYIVHTVNAIEVLGTSNTKRADFLPADGEDSSFLPASGSVTYTFEAGSGDGISLDDPYTDLSTKKITVNATYIRVLWGATPTPVAGTIFTIDGTIYNDTTRRKIVFNNCQLQYNGSAWAVYTPSVEYTTYEIGALELHGNSNGGGQSGNNAALYLQRADGEALPFQRWENPFVLESGDGLKVNGNSVELIEMQSTGDGLFIKFDALNARDVISISGTFVCENQHIKYTIAESKFVWNGSAWEKYVDYTTYEVGKVLMTGSSSATAVYFYREDEAGFAATDGTWTEKLTFLVGSGIGITINGVAISMNDIKIPGDIYAALGTTAKKGDVLAIGGTFYNVNLAVKYVISDSYFEFNGNKWLRAYDDSQLAVYDEVTISDLDLGVEKELSGGYDGAGLSYVPNTNNTTGSVKFRFGYQSADLEQGEVAIRLRGDAWHGIHFRLIWGGLCDADQFGMEKIALNNNQYYVIEIGAIDTAEGNHIWVYVRVDGVIQFSTRVAKTDIAQTEGEGENRIEYKYGDYNTTHVSIYVSNLAASTLSDPDHISITYTTAMGSITRYAECNSEYTLLPGRSYDTFIGWVANGALYGDGEVITTGTTNLVFTALEIDFTLQEGAAIRLGNAAENSGIRFTALLDKADLDGLSAYGIREVSYGMLILPYDYLAANQAPNLEDFIPYVDRLISGKTVMKFVSDPTKEKVENGVIEYRGAIEHLYESNYERLWAGRGYIEFTLANGTKKTVYTSFNIEDNVRSIRSVAQRFQADTSAATEGELRYASLTETRKAIVDNYAKTGEINLMKYDRYNASFLALFAWYYPELDPSNEYNNATNIAIAQKLKAAGMKGVYLDGMYHLDLDTNTNIVKTRQIINFFWSQGLYTIAFGSNASTNCHIDYSTREYPDFSDCEGFIGFFVWDEPSGTDNINKLANFANNFEKIYAGTDVTFMVNLLPSYAATFNGTTHRWESTLNSLKKDEYKAYLQNYCDTVLSQLDGGQKWLSLDSYPIKADKSLTPNFLFDLAMLKYYAENNDAHSHIVLQSSGWEEDGNKTQNRMPTEAEMRMQAYAAMAFGIDSISWWSYSDKREDNQSNPTDSDDYYTRFANVNNELSAIGQVYSAFDWKGVILGAGKDNTQKLGDLVISSDDDYEAFNAVKGQIGNYELSVSDTKHLASVSTNKTNWNYLMGVMEDMNGNEGYVLCNYNSHEADRAQTITLTFDSNVTEVVIYRGGVAQTESVNNKTLTVSLAMGEGVIILPSKLG